MLLFSSDHWRLIGFHYPTQRQSASAWCMYAEYLFISLFSRRASEFYIGPAPLSSPALGLVTLHRDTHLPAAPPLDHQPGVWLVQRPAQLSLACSNQTKWLPCGFSLVCLKHVVGKRSLLLGSTFLVLHHQCHLVQVLLPTLISLSNILVSLPNFIHSDRKWEITFLVLSFVFHSAASKISTL